MTTTDQAAPTDELAPRVTTLPVSIVVARENVTDVKWITERWRVDGVVAGRHLAAGEERQQRIRADENGELYLWRGFQLELFKDDCESYYFNLLAENPSVFVACHQDDEQNSALRPFLATVSWDEAASYLEADTAVSSVPAPPEVYLWMEHFVLANYVPEPRKKRKRVDWNDGPRKS